jgi:hypothetical protein
MIFEDLNTGINMTFLRDNAVTITAANMAVAKRFCAMAVAVVAIITATYHVEGTP